MSFIIMGHMNDEQFDLQIIHNMERSFVFNFQQHQSCQRPTTIN